VAKRIISAALGEMNKILRLAGVSSSQETELLDDHVSQVVEILPVVRRSLTQGATEGYYHVVLENVHGAGATSEAAEIDPYNPGAVLNRAPYPATVERGWDFWLVGAMLRRAAGTAANFGEGLLQIVSPLRNMAFGIDDSGVVPVGAGSNLQLAVARWDVLSTVAGTTGTGLTEAGDPWVHIGMRMRRGMLLNFRSNAINALTVDCVLIVGLFPTALGQDIVT